MADTQSPTAEPKLQRLCVAAIDQILGHEFRVLDKGFVRVIDYMGSDESVVRAARISYGKEVKTPEEDRGLIRYLMRHEHTTPFEMCEIKLHVKVPMDCWRQWIRHRTASVNEYSTRYSPAMDDAQGTSSDAWRAQATTNRQGSEGLLGVDVGFELSKSEAAFQESARKLYKDRIDANVAREQARKDLPLSTYTTAYWKIDLHNLLRFLHLRMDAHAQAEIREYANVIGNEIVAKWCPVVWEAFLQYQRNALRLSTLDAELIGHIAGGRAEQAIEAAIRAGLLNGDKTPKQTSRERNEVESKLRQLGIVPPWPTTSQAEK